MSSINSRRQNDLNQELHAAVREGNEANFIALLERGADINAASKNETPRQSLLFLAAEHENDTILRLLIERGANTKDSGVLHAAAIQGDVTRLRYLLDTGLDVDAFHEDRTPLMLAVRYGPVAAVRFLIEQGADVNAQAEDGHTVLSQSYKGVFKSKDDRKIASMLRKAGAHDDYDGFINSVVGIFSFLVFFQTIVTLPLHLPLNLFWHIADSRRSSKNKTPA